MLLIGGCSTDSSSSTSAAGHAVPTVAVPAAARDLEETVQAVIRKVQPSVAEIQCSGAREQSLGSGDVIRSDGYIVTNDHVVRGFSACNVVLSNGQTVAAQLAGEAPGDDLAVLKVNVSGWLPPINLADSNQVHVGTFVLAIGSPLGLGQSATFGIVSALNRTATEAPDGPAGTLTGLIQTSAPINPGNSGGALVNLRGELIGIPTLAATDANTGTAASGIGFAIASNRVKFVADQLVQNGRLANTGQGSLGISAADVTPQIAASYGLSVNHGVLITDFRADASGQSPAERAGLQQGDIITALDGQKINTNGDLSGFLLARAPGTKVEVTVQRGSTQHHIGVTLGERPA
jgi:S1-C subfamily serine protease